MKIKNCIAFVTGANRGIGRALVEALLASGAKRVYATARDTKLLAPLAERHGQSVVPLTLDITRPEDVEGATRIARDVNLLINNAGVLASFNALSSPLDRIEADMKTNFFGTLAVTRAFLPCIERAGGGAIANVLTIASLASMPAIGGYSAAKAAAFSMTQALRTELKAKRIAVHAIFPGPVDTDMIRSFAIPKTSPEAVATAILDGIERDEEDICPDPMSREMFAKWRSDPKGLERQFGVI